MNIAKHGTRTLAVLSLAVSVASPSWAGTCTTETRPFPTVQDLITISCDTLAGNTTSGLVGASRLPDLATKSVVANLTTGIRMVSRGIASSGQVVCQVQDNVADGNTLSVSCPSTAVNWNGFAVYNN
jgi:hypothetical protein